LCLLFFYSMKIGQKVIQDEDKAGNQVRM
jgi:hypothetical protein